MNWLRRVVGGTTGSARVDAIFGDGVGVSIRRDGSGIGWHVGI